MKITKIQIKNLFGIREYVSDGSSVEISGKNGVGKSSVIDAIKYALTNKSDREYIVKNGANEGEIIIETDNGLLINRKSRTTKGDYKSIKQNGHEVSSPETFLKDIFTQLQLSPIAFMNMDKKQQATVILDMIEYDWDLNKIKEWFGELPSWVNYEQNILQVLSDIQSEDGEYYKQRRDIQRDARNKKAFVEEIASTIPSNYDLKYWENENLGDTYRKIERIQKENEDIQKALNLSENKNNKVRKFKADLEIEKAAIDRELSGKRERLNKDIANYERQIAILREQLSNIDREKSDKEQIAEQKYKANVSEYEAQVNEYKHLIGKEIKDTTELTEYANHVEKMKEHINEYKRMLVLQEEVEELNSKAEKLTNKIEKARELPGEILAECTILVEGLTVVNGTPLINGLPVSNLSEGEKLDLCIDVAIQKPNGLQIILIDGVEKLATELREQLYAKCKSKGLQFIATRTTDEDSLTVVEL